jgi:ABC-type antimicrobial peptide transport system permease subunit
MLTRLRVELRTRWRAWVAVVFLVGVAGGVVLTTAAGARRTGSAYARFLRASRATDMLVSPDNTGFPGYYGTLERATGAQVTPVIGFGAASVQQPTLGLLVAASPDARWATAVERPKITAGRVFDPADGTEVVADLTAARMLHLHAGSRVRLAIATREEELPNLTRDAKITVTVVGIGVTRDSVVTVNALASAPTLYAGPAFTRKFGENDYAFDGAYVGLRPGQSKSAFTTTAQGLARRFPQTGGSVLVADETEQAAKVEHAIRPQAVALALFAALTALTALFAIGQLLARQVSLASTDNHVLRALGMSRRQLFTVALVEVGLAAIAGALIAMMVAVVASPLMPIGPARLAEPQPGIAADWLVLGAGFVLIVALFVASATWPAWRAAQAATTRDRNVASARRPSRLTRWATTAGAPPATAIGVGYAVDPGRGRTAVPVRSAIAVTALAVTALAGALTFGANLSRLVHTPKLYGQSWDVTADAQFGSLPSARVVSLLRKEPGVTAWTFGVHDDVTIAGQEVPTIGLTRAEGSLLAPTVLSGRVADSSHDIVLGTKTLEHAHRRVGQVVTVDFQVSCCDPGAKAPPPANLRIVGRGVFPFFGEGSFTPTGLGIGAQVSGPTGIGSSASRPANFVLVDVAPGPDHDAEVTRLTRDLGRSPLCTADNQCTVSTTNRPTDVLNYSRVQSTPLALAAVLALLAIGVVANLLVSSIRRRRRDFAILKTLGFRRRQLSATVAWQATTLVGVALVIGLPIGTALGRWVWSTFARDLGVPADAHTPTAALLLAIPAALVIGNLIAAVPGALARRSPPAKALRTE